MSLNQLTVAQLKTEEGQLLMLEELINLTICLCESSRDLIAIQKRAPAFMSVFPAKEIIAINGVDREVSGLINELKKMKQLIEDKTFDFSKESQYQKRLGEIQARNKEISTLIESMGAKIPKPKGACFLVWIIFPYTLLECFIKKCLYRIEIKRLEKMKERIEVEEQGED